MDQNAKRTGAINWVVMLGATIGMMVVSRYVSSAAAVMATILTGYGLLVALLTLFPSRPAGAGAVREDGDGGVEQIARQRVAFRHGRGGHVSGAAVAGTVRAVFRSVLHDPVVPAASGGGVVAVEKAGADAAIVTDRATLAMALLGLMALLLFLLGKYSSGLARLQGREAVAPRRGLHALERLCLLLTAVGDDRGGLAGVPEVDLIVARVMCVVSGLAAVETLLALILEGYRVRVQGRETRLLYDSRLVGLLGQPEAIITTAAHALDYQFGFKVSETWFYRFLEKALGWMCAGAIWGRWFFPPALSSSSPGTEALLERCGKPLGVNGVIGPGLHLKLPWPIDRTQVFHTERIQTFLVGAEPETGETIAWATPHAKEENFLVASRELNGAAPPTNRGGQRPAGEPALGEHPGAISNHQSGGLGLHERGPRRVADQRGRAGGDPIPGQRGILTV